LDHLAAGQWGKAQVQEVYQGDFLRGVLGKRKRHPARYSDLDGLQSRHAAFLLFALQSALNILTT
jgi:hypothetical protein